ncbi:hypothetical protein CL617_00720 [archaeon]|nr:hypothetical protein [archaeon]|tara:strand:- start:2405 stop:3472 length:1068 start_codon:yes stop_codon:yes gene_type:complete
MINVIGAGYIGSYTSYLLAKNGFKVNVYEEHKEIGKPVRDTGIVTSTLNNLINVQKDFIQNEVTKVKIFSGKEFLELDVKKEYVLDRVEFDKYLLQLAIDNGAKLFLDHRLVDFNKGKLKFSNDKVIENEKLVGADGPGSFIAKKSGLIKNREYLIGKEARVKMKIDENAFEVYPSLVNDFFGWVVPEGNGIVRIGIASKNNIKEHFDKFLKMKNVKKVLEHTGGLITVYKKNYKFFRDNIYLVGEAAGLVKNTTGGGILTGMISSQELLKSFKQGKDYNKLIKKRLRKELFYHDLIRKSLDKFSEKNYEDLMKLLSQDKVTNLMKTMNRDFPSTFGFKLLLMEPRLLKFGLKLI